MKVGSVAPGVGSGGAANGVEPAIVPSDRTDTTKIAFFSFVTSVPRCSVAGVEEAAAPGDGASCMARRDTYVPMSDPVEAANGPSEECAWRQE